MSAHAKHAAAIKIESHNLQKNHESHLLRDLTKTISPTKANVIPNDLIDRGFIAFFKDLIQGAIVSASG